MDDTLTQIPKTTHRSTLAAADEELLQAAESVRLRAYAPYSNFLVGAALRSADGRLLLGANMENASYGLTLCAEAAVLTRCVAETGGLLVSAIAVVGAPRAAGPEYRSPTVPCGRCRQLLLEAAHVAGDDIRILCAYPGATEVFVTSVATLLPHGFGPAHLQPG